MKIDALKILEYALSESRHTIHRLLWELMSVSDLSLLWKCGYV